MKIICRFEKNGVSLTCPEKVDYYMGMNVDAEKNND